MDPGIDEDAETQRVLELLRDTPRTVNGTSERLGGMRGDDPAEPADVHEDTAMKDTEEEQRVPALAVPDHPTEIEPDAVLTFVKGPRNGSRIAIRRDAIILGSPPSADVMLPVQPGPGGSPRIRIWKQADSYLLEQVEGPLVLIGGRPIDMPIVVLDNGDQIEIGENVLRFERLADEPQAGESRVIRMPFQSAG